MSIITSTFYRLFLALCLCSALPVSAKDHFSLAWSHYTGWEPWGYAQQEHIITKWAKKYGITIDVVRTDYIPSIDAYLSGKHDAVTATNMDMLRMTGSARVDSTALIIGDYSNGNDGIVSKKTLSIQSIRGREVSLVKSSVSHYLLNRALAMNNINPYTVKTRDIGETDILTQFQNNTDMLTSTWNPILSQLLGQPNAKLLFSSAQIPGEILDITFVHSNVDERFKRALSGAWYETMAILENAKHPKHLALISYITKLNDVDREPHLALLKSTAFYTRPRRAASFSRNLSLKTTMEYVKHFCFRHGLFSADFPSADHIGISYPDGTTRGNSNNILLRFTDHYMLLAANKQL